MNRNEIKNDIAKTVIKKLKRNHVRGVYIKPMSVFSTDKFVYRCDSGDFKYNVQPWANKMLPNEIIGIQLCEYRDLNDEIKTSDFNLLFKKEIDCRQIHNETITTAPLSAAPTNVLHDLRNALMNK